MEFTGERFLSNLNSENTQINYEHWHRYLYATKLVENKVVLDIACGEGYGSYLLSQYAEKVIGVDVDQIAINNAEDNYNNDNLEFKQGSASDIPIDGEAIFDIIVSFETIEHIPEEAQKCFLEGVKRLLKPGGFFIVSTPDKLTYSDIPNYKNEFHVKEFYVDEFKEFLGSYFKNYIFMGQRCYQGSYVWDLDNPIETTSEYRLDYSDGRFQPTEKQKSNLYVLAVCSDSEIKPQESSILIDLSSSMEQILNIRNQQLAEKDQRLAEKDQQLAEILSSKSWNLTEPLRKLKRLLASKKSG